MKININQIKDAKFGSLQVYSIYKGSNKIFEYGSIKNKSITYSFCEVIDSSLYLDRECFTHAFNSSNELRAKVKIYLKNKKYVLFDLDDPNEIPDSISKYRINEVEKIEILYEDYYDSIIFGNNMKKYTETLVSDIKYVKDCSRLFKDFIKLKNISIKSESCNNSKEMFYNCISLIELDLSNFNTSNITDMSYMFYNCNKLLSDKLEFLSSFNTSKVTDMSYMFDGCSLLTSLDLSSFNTSNVKSMKNMFNECSSLIELDLYNFDTSNVENMSFMFNECNKLQDLNILSFNTELTKNMQFMFYNCISLKYLDLSSFMVIETLTDYMLSNVICNVKVGNDFLKNEKECYYNGKFIRDNELGYLILSYIFDPNIEENYMPYKLEAKNILIKDIIIDKNNIKRYIYSEEEKINEISFYNGKAIKEINYLKIDKDTNILRKDNENNTIGLFMNCSNLKKINTYGCCSYSYACTSYMFYNCESLLSLDLSYPNCYIYSQFLLKTFYNCKSLKKLKLPNYDPHGPNTGYFLQDTFYNCYSLEELDLSYIRSNNKNVGDIFKNVKCDIYISSGIFNLKESDCNYNGKFKEKPYSLYLEYEFDKSINSNFIPSFNLINYNIVDEELDNSIINRKIFSNEPLVNINFNSNKSIKSLKYLINDYSFSNSFERLFFNCSSLESININNLDTSKVESMKSMFYGCSSLTSLDLSNFDTSKVTDMYCMFCDCSSLTSLDLSNFDTSNVTSMHMMFYDCKSLTSLDISSFNISNLNEIDCMFDGCSSLTSLDVSSFDTSKITDMSFMFSGCSSLTSLDLSNFDTSNVTNMRYMFSYCRSLTSLDLSNFDTSNVQYMNDMFCICESLTSLNVSSFNTSNVYSMDSMFYECLSLIELDLSNFNVNYSKTTSDMFRSVKAIVKIDPNKFLKTEAECNYTGTFVTT